MTVSIWNSWRRQVQAHRVPAVGLLGALVLPRVERISGVWLFVLLA